MFRARPAEPAAGAAPTSVRAPLRVVDVLVRTFYAVVSIVVLIFVAVVMLPAG
jgi:hypothetical protein